MASIQALGRLVLVSFVEVCCFTDSSKKCNYYCWTPAQSIPVVEFGSRSVCLKIKFGSLSWIVSKIDMLKCLGNMLVRKTGQKPARIRELLYGSWKILFSIVKPVLQFPHSDSKFDPPFFSQCGN